MKKIRIGTLIVSLAIPLLTGMISAAIASSGMAVYGTMRKPPLSPPAWVFSVAWTILYLMMGLASYFIFTSETEGRLKKNALLFYLIQLAMNFLWSILFFNWGMYLFAFLWLFVMWCVVGICTIRFYGIDKMAGYLMIPYMLWLTFAGYLNMGAYVLKIRG